MKKLYEDTENFTANPEFELLSEEGRFTFRNRSGHLVQTDSIGQAIWKNLPGTFAEILKTVRGSHDVSADFLEEFLFILRRSEIILSSIEKKQTKEDPESSGNLDETEALISAIIVTCNSMEHIEECLTSLMNQTYRNLEIHVVDNCSQDQTVDFICENFPDVIVHPLKKNLFYPGGLNYGMKIARGEYFLVLNDDVQLERDCVFHMAAKMNKEKDAGGVVPMLKFYHLRGFINGIGNNIRNYGWGSDNFIGFVDIGQFKDLKEVPSACVSAFLVRKEAVDEVGFLDEKYIAYYEDVDWSFRFWLFGWKIVPAVKALVYHKFGAFWKTMERKLKLAIRNRLRLVLKIFQGKILAGFVRRYFKEDVKNFVHLLKTKEFGMMASYPRAYFSLLVMLPDILRKRRKLMKMKLKNVREKDILGKNPEFFSGLNDKNIPVVDSDLYFRYYRLEFNKMRSLSEEKKG